MAPREVPQGDNLIFIPNAIIVAASDPFPLDQSLAYQAMLRRLYSLSDCWILRSCSIAIMKLCPASSPAARSTAEH